MGSLNKKEGVKLVAKTLVATSVIGTGTYYIDIPNMSTVMAYAEAVDLSNATAAVVKAEGTKLQIDVDNARSLVNVLSSGTDKTSLSSRLDVVQAYINSLTGQTTTGAAVTIAGQTTTGASVTTTTAAVSIKVTDINITGENAILTKGGTVQLSATATPDNATNKSVAWTSSDTNIATVNDNGLVTAKANGNVIITATAKDGSNVSKTKNITITGQTTTTNQTTPTSSSGIKVTGISISGENAISTKGGTVQLSATATPDNATNKTVTWSSSNTSIAIVSSTGVVTAKTDGSVTITATATDGSGVLGTKTIAVTGQATSNSTDTNASSSVLKSVSISGTEEVGRTLKSKIKYDGTEPSVEYQWQRASSKNGDYSDISGAKDDSYKLKSSDKNKYIRLAVTTTVNGNTYTVYDTTSRIDKSDNTEDDTTSSTSNNADNSSSQSYNSYTPSMSGNNLIFTGEGQFVNPSGIPVRGWMSSGDKWYYLDSNGVAKTGWVSDKGYWYYLDPNVGSTHATMKTGWISDNGKWYYLNSSGAMLANTTIDGYVLGSDGAWVG